MAAGIYNLLIEQGADFTRTVTWYTDAAMTSPQNLTGYAAKLKVKNGAGATILDSTAGDLTLTLGGALGTVAISITAAKTTSLAATDDYTLDWDLELTSGGGTVTRLLQGKAKVAKGISL